MLTARAAVKPGVRSSVPGMRNAHLNYSMLPPAIASRARGAAIRGQLARLRTLHRAAPRDDG